MDNGTVRDACLISQSPGKHCLKPWRGVIIRIAYRGRRTALVDGDAEPYSLLSFERIKLKHPFLEEWWFSMGWNIYQKFHIQFLPRSNKSTVVKRTVSFGFGYVEGLDPSLWCVREVMEPLISRVYCHWHFEGDEGSVSFSPSQPWYKWLDSTTMAQNRVNQSWTVSFKAVNNNKNPLIFKRNYFNSWLYR